jgi:CTP:molybdopterin cytidylyltransferase MocA
MIPIEQTVAVLLCAGLSRRHPRGCKLLREVGGRPLVTYAAATIAWLPFRARVAVVPPCTANADLHQLLAGFEFRLVENARREDGQDSSVRAGVRAAILHEPGAVLVSLGDMPRVSSTHLVAIAAAADNESPVASGYGGHRSPPCLFPANLLGALLNDAIAPRAIMAGSSTRVVPGSAAMLADFDTDEDFETAGHGPVRC